METTETRNKARHELELLLSKVQNIPRLIKSDADTEDIIFTLEKALPEGIVLTKGIAPFFERENDIKTVYAVWLFLRNQLQYKKDVIGRQDIRLPHFFLKTNEGDCKSFSLFAASILANLGFNVGFRYAEYDPARGYSHVYCVAKKGGVLYICDGVYHTFDREKPFIKAKTNFMNTYILGATEEPLTMAEKGKMINQQMEKIMSEFVRNPELRKLPYDEQRRLIAEKKSDIQRRVTDAMESAYMTGPEIGKLTKEQRKAKRKRINDRIKKGFGKLGKGLMFLTLGAGRGAFMALIAMNLNGMATKFQMLIDKGKFGSLEKIWSKLGGIKKLLIKSINAGKKHKPLFLSKKAHAKFNALGLHGTYMEGIGVLPLAALAAAAIPVIPPLVIEMVKVFKGLGMHKDAEQVATGGESIVEETQPVINQQLREQGENPADYASEGAEGSEDSGPAVGAFDFTSLVDNLSSLAQQGLQAAGGAIHKKLSKTKGGQALLNNPVPNVSDDQYANQYLKQHNYKPLPGGDVSHRGISSYIPWIVGGVGFTVLGAVVLSKKK